MKYHFLAQNKHIGTIIDIYSDQQAKDTLLWNRRKSVILHSSSVQART